MALMQQVLVATVRACLCSGALALWVAHPALAQPEHGEVNQFAEELPDGDEYQEIMARQMPPEESEEALAAVVAEEAERAQEKSRVEDRPDVPRKPFGLDLVLDTAVGTGTFVLDPYARNSLVTSALTLLPYFSFPVLGQELTLQLRWDIAWEYTDPDVASGRRLSPYDVHVALKDKGLVDLAGFGVDLEIGFLLPTSFESIAAQMLVATHLSTTVRYEIHGFELSYAGTARKFFNLEGAARVPVYYRPLVRGNTAALGSASPSVRVVNELSATYDFPFLDGVAVLDGVYVLADFMLVNDFNEDIVPADDPYTSPHAKSGGGREDWFWPTLELGIEATSRITVALGITSYHPAIDATTERVILPLFGAFDSLAADNYTSVYLDVTASF